MKTSPARLRKHISQKFIENCQKESRMSDLDVRHHSRKKNKTKIFISLSDHQIHADPRFSKLDISEIKKSTEYEAIGEVTNKVGWNQSENLDNLLYQFSSFERIKCNSLKHCSQQISREQIQIKFRQTCCMFNSILKSLKLQITMLKNITLKEVHKQKILHSQFIAQFQKVRKRLHNENLASRREIDENISTILRLNEKLQQKNEEQKRLVDLATKNELKVAELILQINKVKSQNFDQLQSLNQEKNKIIEENKQLKTKVLSLSQKILTLNEKILNKNNTEIELPNLILTKQRSEQFFPQPPTQKQQKSPKNNNRYSYKTTRKLSQPPTSQYYPLTSRLLNEADLWPISGQQVYPEVAVSQICRVEDNNKIVNGIREGNFDRKLSFSPKKPLPLLNSAINLYNYKTKNTTTVVQKLNIIKAQIEDEIKVLKSSISTNI